MMSNTKTQNATSASDTSIGFDYQFYYFFWLLLGLKHGESIGLEDKDDVHAELADGSMIFIQTKHTLQLNKLGNSINLTELDNDLWKTLSNWTKIINEQSDPKGFIANTSFQISSNKNGSNAFLEKIAKIQSGDLKAKDLKQYLKELINKTTDNAKKGYIDRLLKLKSALLADFANKILFELNHDELIEKIKIRLLEKIHIKERIEDVYRNLHSALRDTGYLNTKKGLKNVISFEDFNTKFGPCFKVAISTKLPLRKLPYILPDHPEQQHFIKQLIDIGDIAASDFSEIISFTTQMLQLLNNLKEWENNGDLLSTDRNTLDNETKLIHLNSFRSVYRAIRKKLDQGFIIKDIDDEIKDLALNLLDEMRKQILQFDQTLFTTELSNGHFYLLTEEKAIGWHFDWKNRY